MCHQFLSIESCAAYSLKNNWLILNIVLMEVSIFANSNVDYRSDSQYRDVWARTNCRLKTC